MALLRLCVLALLFASTTAFLDCFSGNICYGSPNINCDSLLKIDAEGSVLKMNKNVTGSVDGLDNFYFCCVDDVAEVSVKFQHRQFFFVSKSSFNSDLIVDCEYPLYNLNYDEHLEEVAMVPSIYYYGQSALEKTMRKTVKSPDSKNSENTTHIETRSKLQTKHSAHIKCDLMRGIEYVSNIYLQHRLENEIITDPTQYDNYYDDLKIRHTRQKGLRLSSEENNLVSRLLEDESQAEENAENDYQLKFNATISRNSHGMNTVELGMDEVLDSVCLDENTLFDVYMEEMCFVENGEKTNANDPYHDEKTTPGVISNTGRQSKSGWFWLTWVVVGLGMMNVGEDEATAARRRQYARTGRRLSSSGYEIATNARPRLPSSSRPSSSTTTTSNSSASSSSATVPEQCFCTQNTTTSTLAQTPASVKTPKKSSETPQKRKINESQSDTPQTKGKRLNAKQ